jgi:hypothetical protein
MASLREITFSIINTVRPKIVNGDSITKELVNFHVNNVRAQLAKQQIGKYGTLEKSYVQSLGCLELELADKSECCEYPTGCKILRTVLNIPQTINDSLLTRVGPVDLSEASFNHIEYERVPFSGYNKYTKNIKRWFRKDHNGPIYIVVNENDLLDQSLEVISADGVFENPQDLQSFLSCSTGEVCFSDSSRYPVPASMIPIIQDIIIKSFVGVQSKSPIDSSNDNNINPTPQIVNK